MDVNIKRIDPTLPMPEYLTPGAIAFDLYARERMEILPGAVERIPTNFVIEIPKGYMLLLRDRSSTAKRKGLNATAGFVDQDFCGDTDEILFQVHNFTTSTVVVERGERIGQAAFVAIEKPTWHEVDSMKNTSRGGFGTTGF